MKLARRPEDRYRLFRPTNSADFDENYQPINSQYPISAPGRYTVGLQKFDWRGVAASAVGWCQT